MALPKLMRNIFENDGAGPKFLEGKVPKDFSEAISAPGASFTGNVSATTVNATSLVVTGESNLGYARIRGAGVLLAESGSSKGLVVSADLPDGTFGAIVSVRSVTDPQIPGGICFYTRTPESGANANHSMKFHNDGSLRIDGKKMVYVTDTQVSSDHSWWYRKYSDGWIEQGGFAVTINNKTSHYTVDTTVTFPVAFSSPNYQLLNVGFVIGSSGEQYLISKTATGFKTGSKVNESGTSSWYACGY